MCRPHKVDKMELLRAAKEICRELKKHNYRSWIVGGAVRDLYTESEPHDIDMCTDAVPSEVESIFLLAGNDEYNYFTRPIGIEFGTIQVVVLDRILAETCEIELTTLRKDLSCDGRWAEVEYTDDIVEDLGRRDFTINAMAMPLDGGELINPFDGLVDLHNRTIRAVGNADDRFKEDALRMIRACRFAGYDKGYTIEPITWAAIKRNKLLVNNVSRERISMELMKMMAVPKPSKCINALKNAELLELMIPPVAVCVGVEQNQYHDELVYEHCIMACDAAPQDNVRLRLAALLHDVGKPGTAERDKFDGEFHFYNHEVTGATIAYEYLMDYRFGRDIAEYVSLLIRHHMFRFTKETKRKTIKRWMNKLKGYHEDVIKLRLADRAGNRAKRDRPLITQAMRDLLHEIEEIKNTKEPMSLQDLKFSGNDLIEMGYTPGPIFGIVLNQLLERVLDDPETNKLEVLSELAKEILASIDA